MDIIRDIAIKCLASVNVAQPHRATVTFIMSGRTVRNRNATEWNVMERGIIKQNEVE